MNESRFVELALANKVNRAIIERLPALDLSDAWLVSGSLFQSAWNGLTGRPVGHGIKDYDIFYYDADLSWEAEDIVIRRGEDFFGDLDVQIQIRNQARVHLWYPEKFGEPYPPLRHAREGIDRFLVRASTVGIRAEGGAIITYAPHGFDDIETMIVRANRVPNFNAEHYAAKAARWKSSWPELTVLPA